MPQGLPGVPPDGNHRRHKTDEDGWRSGSRPRLRRPARALGRRLARGGGRGCVKDPGLMLPLLVVSALRHDAADLLVAERHATGR